MLTAESQPVEKQVSDPVFGAPHRAATLPDTALTPHREEQ